MANNEQSTQKNKGNLFSALRRLFSSDVIIRNEGGGQLKVIDTEHIQSNGVIQTNSLVDRFHKVYTTSTAYGVNLNLSQNYRSARVQIYADYDAMDTDAIIASALDIISDECTLKNEQGEVLQIRSSDENIQRILYNLFYSVLNIEFNLWSWIRNMCKYGDFYLKLEIAENYGVYNVIPFSAYNIAREEGYNPKNPNEVRFKFDPNAAIASTSTGYSNTNNDRDPGVFFDNYEMAHFRLTGDVNYLPYGRSYLEPARKLFKQYVLIEDAMLIHRIVRAPEKRVFYVNIGSIPPGEVENFMQRMINKMKKTPLMDPQTGQYNLKYNIQNMLEDIYIPVRGNDATTRIDTAKGLDYNGIEDVQYFREKLFAALKIPKAFLGYEKDLSGKATLAAEDIRFARTIERIQRIITSELTKIALIHLYANGYTNESAANFTITLTNPSVILEQERIALFKEKIDLANQAMESKLLPRDFIYDKIFQFSEDQYSEMDDMIIEDQKRTFRYNQIIEEGNDPAETGQAFGTPHQLASLYGGKAQTSLDVPTGYDETNPSEPTKLPGRPEKYKSIIGKDESPFGRDRIGRLGMNDRSQSGEDDMKLNFTGGSPLALENTMVEFLKLKSSLEKLPKVNPKNVGRKTQLWEESDLEGRKTDLFNEPEILKQASIISEKIFKNSTNSNTELFNEEVSKTIDIDDESKILDDFNLKLKNKKTIKEDIVAPENNIEVSKPAPISIEVLEDEPTLLEDVNIISEKELTDFGTNILDSIDSVLEELESVKNELNETTLLEEDNIVEEKNFIALEKLTPERLLKEDHISDDSTFKESVVTLLETDNIIPDSSFEKDNTTKIVDITDTNNIIPDSSFEKDLTPQTLDITDTDNIIPESDLKDVDTLVKKIDLVLESNTTVLNDDQVIDENVFHELDKQFPITLLEEQNIIDEDKKEESNEIKMEEALIKSDSEVEHVPNEKTLDESGLIDGIDNEDNNGEQNQEDIK